MKLWASNCQHEPYCGFDMCEYVEASPAEILAAARPHADLEAAMTGELIMIEECRDCGGSGCSWCADTGRVRERKPTPKELLVAVQQAVEAGATEGEVEQCPRCKGNGYEVVEHIRAVPEHHPSCVGGSECGSTCPVPAPYPEYERAACPACRGLGSYLVLPVAALGADDEAAAKAEREERG